MVTDGVNGMLQSNYGTSGSEGGYGLNPAAFAAYSNHAGYPGNMGASGQEMYAANAMYSQGFVTASQVISQQVIKCYKGTCKAKNRVQLPCIEF